LNLELPVAGVGEANVVPAVGDGGGNLDGEISEGGRGIGGGAGDDGDRSGAATAEVEGVGSKLASKTSLTRKSGRPSSVG